MKRPIARPFFAFALAGALALAPATGSRAPTAAPPAKPPAKVPAKAGTKDDPKAAVRQHALGTGAPADVKADPKAAAKQAALDAADAASQEPFLDVVNVTVVNVDVYVTDKKGSRVSGLKQGDFEVFEDGKPMAITNFYAVEGGKSLEPPPPPGTPVPPPVVGAPPVPTAPVPVDQRLRLIVYIDNFNIHPFNRNRVMRDLRGFIRDTVKRDDLVMLVSYERSLHVRQNFTSDPELVAQRLTELERFTGSAVTSDSERKDALRRVEESTSASEASSIARSYAESVMNDLSFSIDGLKSMVNSLAGMPGRKAVLYISDGLPMMAGQDLFYAVQGKYHDTTSPLTEAFDFDASRRFTELTSLANANRVTFYTVDAGGLRTLSSSSAENFDPGQGAFIDQIQMANMQSPLQTLAEETGGVAVLNANQIGPRLAKLGEDFNSYYSLGYTPVHAGDGRYHKIDVKVKTKKVQVRHREGYRDKSSESQMTDGTLAALQFPYEENPLGVSLEFGAGTPRDDGYFVVPVAVKIPIGKLVLVPREVSQDASVRLFVAAIDDRGDTSEVQQQRVPIQIPNQDVAGAKAKFYTYTLNLLMRGGDHKVAVGVRDDAAAQASFLARGVHVGS